MTAKCRDCNTYWNISIKQRIPKKGYECPICMKEKKKPHKCGNTSKAHNKIILSAV